MAALLYPLGMLCLKQALLIIMEQLTISLSGLHSPITLYGIRVWGLDIRKKMVYYEGGEALEKVSQRKCGCPIPGNV